MVRVAVDDREPSVVVRELREHPDVTDVEVRRLEAGDLVVGKTGFERKTLDDYVGSVVGRTGSDLRDQVLKLTEGYDHAYVLLEGNLSDVADMNPEVRQAVVHGSMASFTARHDAPVLPCSDCERLVDVAVRIGRKHLESPTARPVPSGTVTGRTAPTTKRIYGCIEGVGPATADALYEAFPTVEALLDASEAELLDVAGVGEKRARAVRAAFCETD
ncbi:ERCC4 domain-containing protein [Halomicrococcus sp. SG-WS-1]|uniref:ERCC4 domain-containing protein n=1 Tax=Halomicrococcus sp. SG-WS-1 TaxID=3439057 RepID=UPI003F7AF8DE